MVAPAHPRSKPVAQPPFLETEPHFCVFSAEGACAEIPLPDAEPLTSEPPLAEAAHLTSESAVFEPDPARP